MRIVYTIEFRSASVRRGQTAARPISESPGRRGPRVTVETTQVGAGSQSVTDGARPEELDIWGEAVRVLAREVSRQRAPQQTGDFDVMMNHAGERLATERVFPTAHRCRHRKVVATCGFSGLFMWACTFCFARMPDILERHGPSISRSNIYRDPGFAARQRLGQSVFPSTLLPEVSSGTLPRSVSAMTSSTLTSRP